MTLLSQRREVGEFKKRYKWMALFAAVFFVVLVVRAFQMEVLEYQHWADIAVENITKTIQLPATRGIIHDDHGRVVATNRPSYNVYITPHEMQTHGDFTRFATLMGLSAQARDALRQRIAAIPARRQTHQIEMFSDITRDQLAALEAHRNELPSVDVVAVPVRLYPFGAIAAHAIGYLNEVNAEDLERLPGQGYRAGDNIGRSGIEKAWEGYLRGRRGYRRVLVDVRGRTHHEGELPGESRVEPVPGRDLTLTLDMELMRTIERAFRSQPAGAAVVVDVHTGRVRALFSKPSYDLNEMSGRLTEERAAEIRDNQFRPLIDKTIYETYYPASTFKVFGALAALGDNILSPANHLDCPGYYEFGGRRFLCSEIHGHGDTDMRRALVQSCNVYFYDLARQVGLDRLSRYARDFGLGEPTGIGINTESRGEIPDYAWYARRYGNQFRGGFVLNEAIGQGDTKVTMIQLAMAYAAIANGGTLYYPQLVERVSSPDGQQEESFEPRVRRRVNVPHEHLTYVIDGLYGVVNDPLGTAYDARVVGGVPMAGKTGTAQVARHVAREDEDPRNTDYLSRSNAWFAGFAPAGDPEVVIVLVVEHGGGGGRTAAPIALQILQEYLAGSMPPRRDTDAPAARRNARGGH